jgi:signal transduction histidine kinase
MSSFRHLTSLILLLFAGWIGAATAETATLQVGDPVNLLTAATSYRGDEPALPSGIAAVRAAAGDSTLPHDMYSERWFVLTVHNPADAPLRDWVLRMDTDPLFLPVFAVLKDGVVERLHRRDDAVAVGVGSGATLGLGQRFPLYVPPGESREIVLRVAAISFNTLVADIIDLPGYITWATRQHVIVLFALGIILAIGLYNLSLGLAMRRWSHIWYALHALSGFVAWATVFGIFADLFGYTDHDRVVYKLSIAGLVMFSPLFVRSLFAADRMPKAMDRALLVIAAIHGCFVATTLLLWPLPDLHRAWVRGPDYSYLLAMVGNLVMLWAGIWAIWRRIAGAWWFLIGWGAYVASTTYAIPSTFGLYPFTGTTLLLVLLGATWEALLLSQALGARLKALDRERSAAESRREALQTFIASISHDLRAPVLSIIATISAARTQTSDSNLHRLLDLVSRSAATMLGLLSDLLDRQRLATARFQINAVPFDVINVVEDCVAMLRYRAEEKGLKLDYVLEGAIEPGATGDPLRLKQILTNLLDNAVKFSEGGIVSLVVSASSDSTIRRIRFEVADSGPGIPAAQRERVFDPFFKSDPETPGIGLGLPIARHLAALMGGALTMHDNQPRGTRFVVELPLPVASFGEIGHRHTVWFVDDDADQRDTWAQLLTSEMIGVEALHPQTAADHPPQGEIDAVLMDLSIGQEMMALILRRLRKSSIARQVPVIAFSADPDRWTPEVGAMGILPSPGKTMSPAEVAALIRSIVTAAPLIDRARQFEMLDELGHEGLLRALGKFLLLSDQLADRHETAGRALPELLHRLSGSAALLGFPVLAREALRCEKLAELGSPFDLAALRRLMEDGIEQSPAARLARNRMARQGI